MKYLNCVLLALLSFYVTEATATDWQSKIDPEILAELQSGGQVELIVAFTEQADLNMAQHLRGKVAKGRYVYETVWAVAERTQAPVRQILVDAGVAYRPFAIVNALFTTVDLRLATSIAKRAEVANLQPNPWIMLDQPLRDPTPVAGNRGVVEWGVEAIRAPEVWDMGFRGEGVIIGGQDTGYDWEHPTLQSKYRGWDGVSADHNYHWHDAIREINLLHEDSIVSPTNNPCGLDVDVPCDDNNHGTNTMGVMVGDDGGDNQIGVAPAAQWIGCRNMERGYGSPASYIECFDWFLAPTNLAGENPDPGAAPHVINNSWHCPPMEGCNPDNFALMEAAVDALRAAGVVVVVSAGNDGPECETIRNPSTIFAGSFTVGAISDVDTIPDFSSRGAVSIDSSMRLKPNVVAPGVNVRSARRNGGYGQSSGTSLAAPHVAGAIVLIISAVPELEGEVEQLETILEESAIPVLTEQDCDPFLGMAVPNAVTGYGKIDALAAVERARQIVENTMVEQQAWQVFPTPTSGELWISSVASGVQPLAIYAPDGRLVWSGNVLEGLQSIDLSQLVPALYTYRIGVGSEAQSGRIIIQK